MTPTIVAQKQQGNKTVTRKFTKPSWDLLGKPDKNGLKDGWKEVTDQQVINATSKKEEPPATGNKIIPPVIPVDNAVTGKTEEELANEATTAALSKKDKVIVVSDENKQKFIDEILKDETKDTIKNYLDALEIKYGSKDSLPMLKEQLAAHLNYSAEEFKNEF